MIHLLPYVTIILIKIKRKGGYSEMKRFGKVLAFLLVLAMAVSITACGSSQDSEPTSQDGQSSSENNESTKLGTIDGKDPETGLPMLASRNNPITFKVFLGSPGQAPAKDNPVIQKITELTGVTIDFEFLVGDLVQKEGVMIAGGDYPDAIFAESQKFIDAGAYIPLDDKLPNYPNLNELYSPFKEDLTAKYGKTYILELYNVYTPELAPPIFDNGGAGFFIQKDVIAESGYKVPRTLDDYFGMIEAYAAKHPTIDGVKTRGFEILCDGWRDFCLRNPAQHLLGDGNNGDATVDYETDTAYFYQTTDTAKNYYKKLNEEYHKGIIIPDTFTQSYDQYISRISSGAVLGMFDQRWNFSQGENVLKVDEKWNRTYVSVPITNPGVKDGYIDAPNGTITGINGIGITVDCEDPDRLLEFYDYLLQKEVQDYLQWGVEGKDWVKAGENDKVLTEERRALNNDTAKARDLTGSTLWNYCPKRQDLYSDGSPSGPGVSVAEYKAAQSDYDKGFLEAFKIDYPAQLLSEPVKRPVYYPVWAMTIEEGSPAAVAQTAFNDVTRKYYPQLIMCDPAEYDSLWDEFVNAFNAANPQPFLDEVNKQIKEKLSQN